MGRGFIFVALWHKFIGAMEQAVDDAMDETTNVTSRCRTSCSSLTKELL